MLRIKKDSNKKMSYLKLSMDQSQQILEITNALFNLLQNITIPLNYDRNNISEIPVRSITFGKVRLIYKGHLITESKYNTKFPMIWYFIQLLSKVLNINYSSVTLNKNVVCLPHTDKNNEGTSVIISFGDYMGGYLIYDGYKWDTRRPLSFNGQNIHSNTEIINGNKYSLVFFNLK